MPTANFKLVSSESFTVKQEKEGEGIYIEGYASTPVIDRDEEVIPVSAIDTTKWEKNPILLYMHDREKPIGKIVAFEKRPEGLWIKAYISPVVEKTLGIISLIRDGILKAFSIGFIMKDYFIDQVGKLVYKELELLEVSVVSIPANPEAIFGFIKSLKESSQIKSDELKQLKEDGLMPAKIEEMEAQLKKLMEEKERAEKALKEKEEAEKALKEEAEKAALKEEIKTAKEAAEKYSEWVKSFTSSVEELKSELKSVKEEIEVVKEAKPKIEVKSSEERIPVFMDKYKDAVIESQLFGRKFTDTKVFKNLPEGAKSITFDQEFQTRVHDQIIEDVKQQAPLFNLFNVLGSEAKTDVYPFEGTVTAGWGSLSLTNYNFNSKISFDYHKAMAGIEYKYEDEDDAVVSWLPKVRRDITTSLAEVIDNAIINSTGASTFKGLLAYANDNPLETMQELSTTDKSLTAGDLRKARALMKKYGVNSQDVVIVVNSYKYLQLLDDPELVTVDKAGNMATLIKGSAGFVNGSNVVINDSFPGVDTPDGGSTYYSALMFNKNMFATKAKSMLVEIDKDIKTQNKVIVGSMRVSFIPLIPLSAGALPSGYPIVAALNNGA